MERTVPKEILYSMARWNRQSTILQCMYIFLGIIAITAPLVVSSFTDILGELSTRLVSFAGAVAVGLLGGFRLAQKSNDMRRAYIDLRSLVLRFKVCDSMSEDELVNTFAALSLKVGNIDGPGSEQPNRVASRKE